MPTLLRPALQPRINAVLDSRRWDAYRPRDGDIVVATYPKCGTTWTQRIVDLLIHQSSAPRPVMELYPFVEGTMMGPMSRQMEMLDAQTHRRALKSHLPFDALPIYDTVKYIHTARDGRDACASLHNHFVGFTEQGLRIASGLQDQPDAPVRPVPQDLRGFFLEWISDAEAGRPMRGMELSYFDFEMTYWRERDRPNLLLVHYNDLKADLPGGMRRIADFLEIETPPKLLAELADAATFETMKAQGEALLPGARVMWDKGAERFLHRGTNGRWQAALTGGDLARYDRLADARLEPDARRWLAEGSRSMADQAARAP